MLPGFEIWRTAETPNFTHEELACACGCVLVCMDPHFMVWLQKIRNQCDLPLPVTSGFQCEDYNGRLRGGPAHPAGVARQVERDRTIPEHLQAASASRDSPLLGKGV